MAGRVASGSATLTMQGESGEAGEVEVQFEWTTKEEEVGEDEQGIPHAPSPSRMTKGSMDFLRS